MRIRRQREESIQIQVCRYIRIAYPSVIFTAESSGIRLTMGQAVKASKQRSERGLPDLWIDEPRGGYHGLRIELKRDGESPFRKDGKLRAGKHLSEQQAAIDKYLERGYCACFCTGFEEARSVIDGYMALG